MYIKKTERRKTTHSTPIYLHTIIRTHNRSMHHTRALHASIQNHSDRPRRLLLFQYCAGYFSFFFYSTCPQKNGNKSCVKDESLYNNRVFHYFYFLFSVGKGDAFPLYPVIPSWDVFERMHLRGKASNQPRFF